MPVRRRWDDYDEEGANMINSTAIKSATAIVLCLTRAALGDEPPRTRVQSESTDVTRFGPNGIIRLANSSGDLIVEDWDRQEVEVTILKWIDHEVKPDQLPVATQRLQSTSVTVEHISTEEVRVSTVRPHRQVAIKYHIYAPRDSRIVVDHRGGFILLSGLTGDIDIANRTGDIVLMLPHPTSYSIDARDKFGLVTPDVAGATKHKYIIGEQFTRDQQPAAHHMRLRMGFGGITIKEVPPEGQPPVFSGVK
jgi:hypothetical protein